MRVEADGLLVVALGTVEVAGVAMPDDGPLVVQVGQEVGILSKGQLQPPLNALKGLQGGCRVEATDCTQLNLNQGRP